MKLSREKFLKFVLFLNFCHFEQKIACPRSELSWWKINCQGRITRKQFTREELSCKKMYLIKTSWEELSVRRIYTENIVWKKHCPELQNCRENIFTRGIVLRFLNSEHTRDAEDIFLEIDTGRIVQINNCCLEKIFPEKLYFGFGKD